MAPSVHMPFSRIPIATVNVVSRLIRYAQYKPRPDVEHRVVQIPADPNGIRLRVLRPVAVPSDDHCPALVYFHGGAFFLTYLGNHLNCAAEYAARLGAQVTFVEYTLGTFPAGFNDCYNATAWTYEHAEELGIDPERLMIGGDSAGGALAATVAQRARDEGSVPLRGQLLIYPALDRSCSSNSVERFARAPIWTGKSTRRMWKKYLEDFPEDSIPPYAAAADHNNLRGLPPAYIEVAEFDPLHDEGLEYAKRLEADGVEVESNDTKGTIHGYDGFAPRNSITIDSMHRRVAFMERCLSGRK